jgi:hypothetical protein
VLAHAFPVQEYIQPEHDCMIALPEGQSRFLKFCPEAISSVAFSRRRFTFSNHAWAVSRQSSRARLSSFLQTCGPKRSNSHFEKNRVLTPILESKM